MKKLALLGAVVVFALVAARAFMASPLDEVPTTVTALPPASPPAEMRLAAVPSGAMYSSAGFTFRGGDFFDERRMTMAAILVRHPKGDVLFDSGFGSKVADHVHTLPFVARVASKIEHGTPVAKHLQDAGYDPKTLAGIYPTHVHWDHVSGLTDFPGTPVYVCKSEHEFIATGGSMSEVMRTVAPAVLRTFEFEGPAYMGFPASHDLYGDGAIVLVPAPGHTPGSIIAFITTPDQKRYVLIGDITWQVDGITKRAERPVLPRVMLDDDPEGVRKLIVALNALQTKFPELVIVPAHDGSVLAKLPTL